MSLVIGGKRDQEINREADKYTEGSYIEDAFIEKPAFKQGARWADKTTIERVEKYLRDTLKVSGRNVLYHGSMNKLIEQLKKSLEE